MTARADQHRPAPTAAGPRHDPKVVKALRNFTISISAFNILGYTLFGFEQPWAYPFVALAAAYCVEFGLEVVGARVESRNPRFLRGGRRGVLEFLYPATITALAVNMLLYVNDRIWVMVFAVVAAVGGKWVLRAPVKGRLRHFMNPSNLGIVVVLLLFPWAAIAPPYQFTERLAGPADWIVPAVILAAGTLLNSKLTGRTWLIVAWLGGFVVQAVFRGLILDTSILSALSAMTGVAFVLFTNYMITDPGTTPSRPLSQIGFGLGAALAYGVLEATEITYGLFFATAITCLVRGLFLWSLYAVDRARQERPTSAAVAIPSTPLDHQAAKEAVPA
jgi:enediyne biosynthesis protein E5